MNQCDEKEKTNERDNRLDVYLQPAAEERVTRSERSRATYPETYPRRSATIGLHGVPGPSWARGKRLILNDAASCGAILGRARTSLKSTGPRGPWGFESLALRHYSSACAAPIPSNR